jgi:hypothetical protein
MIRTALNYGAMSGLGVFAIFLILYFAKINPLGNASWLAAWIPVVFICKSTQHYREHELEGFISYGQAWHIGTLTGIAGALLSALLVFIFCKVYDASLIDTFKNENLSQLESVESQLKGMFGDGMYDKAVESFQRLDVRTVASSDFFNKTIGAILVSLVTASIYKRDKPKIFQPPAE